MNNDNIETTKSLQLADSIGAEQTLLDLDLESISPVIFSNRSIAVQVLRLARSMEEIKATINQTQEGYTGLETEILRNRKCLDDMTDWKVMLHNQQQITEDFTDDKYRN